MQKKGWNKMKTVQKIQEEIPYAHIISTEDFIEDVKAGLFTDWDGVGSFHDGEKETDIDVECNLMYLVSMKDKYPFVCWYNK